MPSPESSSCAVKCPSCSHVNLTDFPFCEQCLAMLPSAGALAGFGDGERLEDAPFPRGMWPPFPWNPRDLSDSLIGRERIVRELAAGFEQVLTTWTARIHLLVSEYGMGKSRVASALSERALEREPDTLVVRVRCPAAGGPFRMWDALLREVFEIPADADPSDAGALLIDAIEPFLPSEALEVAAPIAYLVGYDVPNKPEPGPGVDEEALIGRGTAATARLLAAVAIQRPILMIVDHANRASARSLALAGAIEATLKGRPVMLVLSGAPELTQILPGWERFPCTRLKPLGRADSERMLRLYLSGLGSVPKELLRRILDQALGNPYALKAMVRYLRSAGAIRSERGAWRLDEGIAWDLELPDNLEGVILAQIGRLTAPERTALARAAVVGHTFWLGALVALERFEAEPQERPGDLVQDDAPEHLRASLDRLVELRFVERREADFPGDETFAFRSDVHWRVASGILPKSTRERFHGVVWQWLALHAGPEPDAYLAELARHAEAAGASREAARYLLRAARVAAQEGHAADNRRYLEAATALVDAEDLPTRASIAFDLGDALRAAGDVESALAEYHDALHTAWRMRHRGKGAAALARIAATEKDRGALDISYGHFLQALRLFEVVGDEPGVADVCQQMGQLFWLRGDFEQALRFYRKAEQLQRRLRNRRGLAAAVHSIGALHFDRGDIVLAVEYLEDALDLRRRLDDRKGVAQTLSTLAVVALTSGDVDKAVTALSEAANLAEGLIDLRLRALIANNLGEALMQADRLDAAAERLADGVSWAREAELPRVLCDALRNTAVLHIARQEWADAERALDEAHGVADQLRLVRMSALVARTQGDLEAARGEHDADPTATRTACEAYRASADAFEGGGYDLEAASSRDLLATTLDALGERTEAAAERELSAALRARHQTRRAGE